MSKNISIYNNIPDYNHKRNNWKFHSKIPKTKTVTLEKPLLQACQKKKCNHNGAQNQYFRIFYQIKISYLAIEH